MILYNAIKGKSYLLAAAIIAMAAVFSLALADNGPTMVNANPQGLVTSSSVKLTMDTEDLARCRYSEDDADYDDMEEMTTPDGLYHYVNLGSLSDGSYTYYARCKDFMGNTNDESVEFKFKVGDLGSSDDGKDKDTDNGASADDTIAPVVSSPSPSGILYDSYATLAVSTNEAANCRYSWYDKTYDSMTLSFTTSNNYYHTAAAQLSSYGYYTYNVRCKDNAGNVNAAAAKISFRYMSRTPVATSYTPSNVATTPKDTTAPVISGLAPSGDVKSATTTISCTTDEKATCKYDTKDNDYDSMANEMDASETGKSFSKSVTLDKASSYIYYVRCKDQAGNKSATSSQIGFTYVIPVVEGPKISNVQPKNGAVILQKNMALILQTDKASECRYSTEDVDYGDMKDEFDTNDGLLQQAIIILDDFGPYNYYVHCADKEGNKDNQSVEINFTYKSANDDKKDEEEVTSGNNKDKKDTGEKKEVDCTQGVTTDEKDGACDNINNCVCDPDCPVTGDKDIDPDCANVKPASDNSWIALLLIGIVLIIVIVIIIVIIKKRGSEEEDVELP